MYEEIACNNRDGPDQVLPATSYSSSKPDGLVKLRIPETGTSMQTAPPVSVPGMMRKTVQKFPDLIAYCVKRPDGSWEGTTFKQYEQNVRNCAKAFLKLGLQRYHSVCILGFNSPEWFISDLAAIYAGGFAAGIYTTNSAEACRYCAENSRANIIVVEDDIQLKKILEVRSSLPNLKAIVQYTGEPTDPGVLSWDELMEIGKAESDEQLDDVMKTLAVNECCTLVYTSGTVGNPKAVMLNHDSMTWDALSISERLHLEKGKEVLISYLPLSHVAAQVVDIYCAIINAATIYFADKNALKGSLVNYLQEVQPTRFLGVPRVWEKIHEKMLQIAAQNGKLKTKLASWAKSHALQHHMDRMNGKESNSWSYSLACSLIFSKIKQALGLARCKTMVSAAAPLSEDVKRYFMSIDILILEAFGMSEAGGAHTLCTDNAFGLTTIGPSLPGATTKIVDPDETGNGEICLYGRHVFMGYLNENEKTAEALDDDGWLHSGDIGCMDKKGMVYITGRIKELLITAGGENVAPVPIEQTLQSFLPHISNVMLIGDKRKFLSILVCLKSEIDNETGAPTEELTKEVQQWLRELDCPAKTVSEVLANGLHPNLSKEIQKAICETNKKAPSNAQQIQKFAILPSDFSIPTGELGPTLKMKRNVVVKKYADIIDGLYK